MNNKRIFALGFFDGVHLGHQALLQQCARLARDTGCEAAAITFDRHPKSLVLQSAPVLISTGADRHRLLKQYGIGYVRQFPVIPEVTGMPWRDFLRELLLDGAVGFVCGDDFRFGWKGEGDALRLQEFCAERNLPCIIVPEQLIGGIRISSTYIRRQIEQGNMETAVDFLGHPYVLSGKIVRDRQALFPDVFTAKLRFPEGLVVPRFGVYACRVLVDGVWYTAVTNIADREPPAGEGITVEPWILDYEHRLQDKQIILEFHSFLRPEESFADSASLRQTLLRDAEDTRQRIQTSFT